MCLDCARRRHARGVVETYVRVFDGVCRRGCACGGTEVNRYGENDCITRAYARVCVTTLDSQCFLVNTK